MEACCRTIVGRQICYAVSDVRTVGGDVLTTTVTNSAQFRYDVGDPISGIIKTYTEPTNTVTINVVSVNLEVVKSVDKAFAVKGETLTYTVTNISSDNTSVLTVLLIRLPGTPG